MTQEEKTKAYDEAVKKLRVLRDDWATTQNRAAKEVEEIFPELKESEDERIKESITEFFKNYSENGTWKAIPDVTKWIAWLEKQGEQKSIDMSIKEKAHQIEWEPSKHYDPLLSKESWCEMAALDMASWLEKQGQDGKVWFYRDDYVREKEKQAYQDGIDNVLNSPQKYGLEQQGEQKPVFEMKSPEGSLGIDSDTYSKIVDECIYGEQKPAWSEEDATHYNRILKELNLQKEMPINASVIEEVKSDIIWLKSLKDRVQAQTKQVWSEEDESIITVICTFLQDYARLSGSESRTIRINEYCDWLKSLRPQTTWKPSDEQIKAVKEAACYSFVFSEKTIDNLISLSKQLKKLRWE